MVALDVTTSFSPTQATSFVFRFIAVGRAAGRWGALLRCAGAARPESATVDAAQRNGKHRGVEKAGRRKHRTRRTQHPKALSERTVTLRA